MAIVFSEKVKTIREIWNYTYQKKRSRFFYAKRDVLKGIRIQSVRTYKQDRLNQPEKKFKITSYSYPQYGQYLRIKGKKSLKQRKIKHQYDIVLVLEDLTWDSRIKYRVGSQRKIKDAPQNKIKQIYAETRLKWKKKLSKTEYKKKRENHKKKAKYLNSGDWQSQVLGINQDFYYRVQPNLYLWDMLFGLPWNTEKYGNGLPFFGKHMVSLLLVLVKRNKIKR